MYIRVFRTYFSSTKSLRVGNKLLYAEIGIKERPCYHNRPPLAKMLTHHSPLLSAGPPEMAAFIAIIFSDSISISDPRDDSLSLCYFCCQPIPTHHPHAPWGQLSLSKPDILPWSIFQLLVLSSLCVSCHASLFPT